MKHDQTIPGGAFEVNGQLVDCNGKPLSDDAVAAYKKLRSDLAKAAQEAPQQPDSEDPTNDTPDTPSAPDNGVQAVVGHVAKGAKPKTYIRQG